MDLSDAAVATRTIGAALLHLIQGDAHSAIEALDAALAKSPSDHELELLKRQAQEEVALLEAPTGEGDSSADEEDYVLRVELPPSWFEGHDDPVRTHPFFLRYIPEMRVRGGAGSFPAYRS